MMLVDWKLWRFVAATLWIVEERSKLMGTLLDTDVCKGWFGDVDEGVVEARCVDTLAGATSAATMVLGQISWTQAVRASSAQALLLPQAFLFISSPGQVGNL
jgi:hypothetical protein